MNGLRQDFAELFRGRALSYGTLPRSLRALTAFACVLLLSSIVLFGLDVLDKGTPVPIGEDDPTGDVPRRVLIAAFVLLALGWVYAIAALFHARTFWLRGLVLALFMTQLGILGFSFLNVVLVLALVGLAVWTWLHSEAHVSGLNVGTSAAVALLVGGLYLSAWVGADSEAELAGVLAGSTSALTLLLMPVLLLAGTDFVEIGETAGTVLASRAGRRSTVVLGVLLVAVAALGLAQSLPPLGRAGPIALAVAAVFAIWLVPIARRVGVGGPDLSYTALTVASLVVFALGAYALSTTRLPVTVIPVLAAYMVGLTLPLLWAIYRWAEHLAPFFLYVWVCTVYSGVVASVLWVVGVPRDLSLILSAYQATLAAGTLLALAWAIVRRPARERLLSLWRALLGVNLAFLVVALIFRALGAAVEFGARITAVEAAIILVGIAWDLLFSSGDVTNRSSARVPRHARLLAFLAYVLISTAAVVLGSGIEVGEAEHWIPMASEDWARFGILVLGVPLIAYRFAPRLWPSVTPPSPSRRRNVLLSAATVVGAFAVFSFLSDTNTTSAPPEWDDYDDPDRGFGISLPPEWETERLSEGDIALRSSDDDLPLRFRLGVQPTQADSLDGIERIFRRQSPNITLFRERLLAGRAQVAAADVENDLTGGRRLSLVTIVFLLDERQYVLQFLGEPDEVQADLPVYYAVADSFHFA